MACRPWWYDASLANMGCPYGRRLPGDVTVPNNPTPLQWLAVVYSVLPYFVVVMVVLEFLIRRRTRQLSIIVFTAFVTVMNEFGIKKLVLQPRPGALGPSPGLLTDMYGEPVGSCNTSCGMPSSHSAMAVGFLTLMLLDGMFRVVPSSGVLGPLEEPSWKFLSLTPLAPKRVMHHEEFAYFFCCWVVLLAPVPLMRVRLHDHSEDQVFVGGALGFVYALLWFKLVSWLVVRYSPSLGRTVCWCLVHDYAPPSFRVEVDDGSGKWVKHEGNAKIVPKQLREFRVEDDSDEESDSEFGKSV